MYISRRYNIFSFFWQWEWTTTNNVQCVITLWCACRVFCLHLIQMHLLMFWIILSWIWSITWYALLNYSFWLWLLEVQSVVFLAFGIYFSLFKMQLVEILPSTLVLYILRKLPPKRISAQYHPIRWLLFIANPNLLIYLPIVYDLIEWFLVR